MRKLIIKKIIVTILALLICLASFGCGAKSEMLPEYEFTCATAQKTFGVFSIELPKDWSVMIEEDINNTEVGKAFFEILSPLDLEGNCTRLEIIKTQEASKNNIKKLLKEDDIDLILTKFQQSYGVNVTLNKSVFFEVGDRDAFYIEIEVDKNDNHYVISQTYFVEGSYVYLINIVAVNGNDLENALNIPNSLKFVE